LHALLLTMLAQLWTEQLTTGKIHDLVEAGHTTVIVATGGIEDNGPYNFTGMHNSVLELVLP